jgi:hypothetical protein
MMPLTLMTVGNTAATTEQGYQQTHTQGVLSWQW